MFPPLDFEYRKKDKIDINASIIEMLSHVPKLLVRLINWLIKSGPVTVPKLKAMERIEHIRVLYKDGENSVTIEGIFVVIIISHNVKKKAASINK